MTSKPSLMASAALGLVGALTVSGLAQAAPKHKHHHAAEAGPSLAQQVQELKNEVESLQQTVQAQASAQQQTQSQLQASEARADAAAAQAQALQAKVDNEVATIPTTVREEVAAQPKPTLDKLKYKGINLQLGGFLEAATIYRSKNIESDMASSFAKIPFGNAPLAHADEFRGSARQSRLTFLASGDINPSLSAAFYGEFDFLGAAQTANSNESNSYTPRIRVLYGTLDWKDYGLHLLAGQNWSLVTLNSHGITPRNEVTPPQIDAQYIPGFAWARQPQVRLTKDFADHQVWIAGSVENPQTTFTGTAGNGLPTGISVVDLATGNSTINGAPTVSSAFSGFNTVNTTSLNHLPDLVGKIAFEPNIGGARPLHIEAFGLWRSFYDVVTVTSANTLGLTPGTYSKDVSGGGWGASVTANVVPKILDLQASYMSGKGIGRYGSAQLSDATLNANGQVAPIQEDMFLVGGTLHATSKIDIYVFGGQEHEDSKISTVNGVNYGFGNLSNANFTAAACDNIGGTCSPTVRQVGQITAGIWDKAYTGSFGQLRIGLQYSHTQLTGFAGPNGFEPKTSADMVFTSFRYYPF